jgi:carboxyl-terminal processing protease
MQRLIHSIIMLSAVGLSLVGCKAPETALSNKAAAAEPVEPILSDLQAEETADDLSDMMVLSEAILLAKRSHVEEHTFRDLVYSAVDGMLQSLDPHSSFLPPEPLSELEEETSGHFGGVGLSVAPGTDGVKVLAPIEDSPAFKAGIQAGDTITAIDGKPLKGMSLDEAVKTMRGEDGSNVKVTVKRASGEKVQVPLVREEIKMTSVKGTADLGDGLGYLRITQFSQSVPEDFAKALQQFHKEGAKGLVIDLRNNPGGLLESAVAVAEQILPKGSEIVSVKGRQTDGTPREFVAGACDARDTKLPLAVLVNHSSASASEILAGALKAHKRAVIVGEQTYGKASVQNVIRLATRPDCAIRLTTAYYYTPDGKLIHGKGIAPDIVVAMSQDDWQRIQRQRLMSEIPGGKSISGIPADPQLERAKEVLKGAEILNGGEKK